MLKKLVLATLFSLLTLGSAYAKCLKCPGNGQLCEHKDLSTQVDIPSGEYTLQVCYAIFGNDDAGQAKHDGVEAWLNTNIGMFGNVALPPGAVSNTPSSTTISRCVDLLVVGPGPFSADVITQSNSVSHWGCVSPKQAVPSEITSVLIPVAQ